MSQEGSCDRLLVRSCEALVQQSEAVPVRGKLARYGCGQEISWRACRRGADVGNRSWCRSQDSRKLVQGAQRVVGFHLVSVVRMGGKVGTCIGRVEPGAS